MERYRPTEKARNIWHGSDANPSTYRILAGTVAALLAWGVIANFSDIKRYIKISRM